MSSKDDSEDPWLEHRTKVIVGQATSAGLLTGFDVASAGWRPKVEIRFWTPNDKVGSIGRSR